jgi:16S rRNA processing protein RimM
VPERQPPRRDVGPTQGFVAVGLVRGARGVHGELKIEPLTDFPERFQRGATLWIEGRPFVVRLSRHQPPALLLQLEGIESRPAAEDLRGRYLEVPESELAQLDEDQYFRFQIVGLEVFDIAGARLGRVEEVLQTGANDVYIVRNDEGELLLPAIDTVVKSVDVAGGRMVVELLEGLERRPLKKPPRTRYSSGSEGAPRPR